jgi:arylsulfatase A-like enzyme
MGGAAGLWVGDALVLLHGRGGATWTQWLTGLGGAFFVAMVTAAITGALLGPIAVPVAGGMVARLRTWWDALDRDGHRSRALAAMALAVVVLASLGALLAHRVVGWILFGLARPDTTEIALTLSHLAFTVGMFVFWPVVLRPARAIVDFLARLPGVRWVLARTWRVLGAFGVLVLAVVGVGAFHYRTELGALPWLGLAPLALVLPGVVATRNIPHLRAPWGRRLGRAGLALFALLAVASIVAAARIHPQSTTAQLIGFDRAMSGRIGYSAFRFALDFDRDGQLNILGGGDCAPFNPHIHAGATDIPNNKIDEDCDGVDLTSTAYRPRSRSSFGQGFVPQRANVIFITIDALGAPRLSALGSPTPLMPNLDAFAASSMLFAHCFSQGPSTRLSFPSIFTSRWDSQLVFSFAPRIPYSVGPKEKQIQDLLDDAGYDTIAVIPNSYFDKGRWPGLTRGFQKVDNSALPAGKHNAPQVTDAALHHLSEQHDRPFYMWVHYYDAHPPYNPINGVNYAERGDKPYYEAELGYIDRELGRLLEAVGKQSQPTYVFISADHSTVFHPNPESRKFYYGYDLYTATLHVPLIVHGPSIKPGRVDEIVSTMDIAPTILDFMHLPQPSQFNGTSLTPEIFSGQHDPNRVLFHEFYLPEFVLRGKDPLQTVAVRDQHWNLILNRDRGLYELYDWQADYFEQHDLYESMWLTPEVGHLRSMIGGFLMQFDNRPDTAALAPPEHIATGEKAEP